MGISVSLNVSNDEIDQVLIPFTAALLDFLTSAIFMSKSAKATAAARRNTYLHTSQSLSNFSSND